MVFVPKFRVEGLIRKRELTVMEPQTLLYAENYALEIEGSPKLEPVLFNNFAISATEKGRTGKRKTNMTIIRVVGKKIEETSSAFAVGQWKNVSYEIWALE